MAGGPVEDDSGAEILRINGLAVSYGGVAAVKSVSLNVAAGEIVALIGANGAGKSTVLRAVSGILSAYGGEVKAGQVVFNGAPLLGLSPVEIVSRGISLVPEGRRLFATLSVRETLELGAYLSRRDRGLVQQRLEDVWGLFPVLRERHRQQSGTLSGGEQQMLAVGRALMSAPKLLLADEPSLGLAPLMVDTLFEKLIEINKAGTSVLIVEQNASMALTNSKRAYVCNLGEIVKAGMSCDLAKDESVREIFLGGSI